jgi:hypothetical protein
VYCNKVDSKLKIKKKNYEADFAKEQYKLRRKQYLHGAGKNINLNCTPKKARFQEGE